MQEKTKAVSKQASKLGLIINKNKTEVMRNLTDRTPITLDGTKLKEEEKFTYLRSTVAMNIDMIQRRTNKLYNKSNIR